MTTVVSNGSSLNFALRIGSYSAGHVGETLFLYNPVGEMGVFTGGMRFASAPPFDLTPSFLELDAGLEHSCTTYADCPAGSPYLIEASQVVPLANPAVMRIFVNAIEVEASGAHDSWPSRIYMLDATDGYVGQDFRMGTGATCGDADYADSGACELTLIFGLDGETLGGRTWDTGLDVVRQSKLAFPELDTGVWNQMAGSAFMVITGADTCDQSEDGLFVANWNGADWIVLRDDSDCAAPITVAGHGPVPVHIGGGRYKIYYEDSSGANNEKPLVMVYVDAARTGNPDVVDFADIDSSTDARQVDFRWPDDTALTAAYESGLGDHTIYLPSGTVDSQVMYMNLGGPDGPEGGGSMGTGMAVLLNP